MSLSPRTRSYLLVAPALTVLGVLFFIPFVYFFLVSFWRVKHYRVVRDFSLDNYATTLAEYFELGIYTLFIALFIGGLTTFLGFVYAYIIRFKAGFLGSAYCSLSPRSRFSEAISSRSMRGRRFWVTKESSTRFLPACRSSRSPSPRCSTVRLRSS